MLRLTYRDVKARLHWSESNDLEFKLDFKEKYWQDDRIFDTIVAMANNEGGNIVIGINESLSGHTRSIVGTNYDATQLGDKLHQLIYEYVDPADLSLNVYVIENKRKSNPRLIGIEIKNEARRFYAKRYHGRSSEKLSTYIFLLRINGRTITADFSTFINYVYGKVFTTKRVLISDHFKSLKDNVIDQALKILETEPDRLPSVKMETNNFTQIDIGLLGDLLVNHYPSIKPLWTKMVRMIENRKTMDNRINEIIETEIKNKLDEIEIKYKTGMYDQNSMRVNAVPIKEVRERLRKLIEINGLESDIDTRLTVEHYTRSSTINFYDTNGQHPDIYKINEGEHINDAKKIKYHLRQIFVTINSRNDIHKFIQQLKKLNSLFDLYKKKLISALREIFFKADLNIVFQCKYLTPELE